jgi:hypothetical protein
VARRRKSVSGNRVGQLPIGCRLYPDSYGSTRAKGISTEKRSSPLVRLGSVMLKAGWAMTRGTGAVIRIRRVEQPWVSQHHVASLGDHLDYATPAVVQDGEWLVRSRRRRVRWAPQWTRCRRRVMRSLDEQVTPPPGSTIEKQKRPISACSGEPMWCRTSCPRCASRPQREALRILEM